MAHLPKKEAGVSRRQPLDVPFMCRCGRLPAAWKIAGPGSLSAGQNETCRDKPGMTWSNRSRYYFIIFAFRAAKSAGITPDNDSMATCLARGPGSGMS